MLEICRRRDFRSAMRNSMLGRDKILEHLDKEEMQPFLLATVDIARNTEGIISNRKIRNFNIALKETKLNVHGYFVNNLLAFISSLQDLLSHDILNNFLKSRLMYNYSKLMNIISWMDEETVEQNGKGAVLPYQNEIKKRLDTYQDNMRGGGTERGLEGNSIDKSTLISKQQRGFSEIFVTKDDICVYIKP